MVGKLRDKMLTPGWRTMGINEENMAIRKNILAKRKMSISFCSKSNRKEEEIT